MTLSLSKSLNLALFSSFLLSILSSCAPTIIGEKKDFSEVPIGTKKIIAYTNSSQKTTLTEVGKFLAKEGFSVSTNSDIQQISTDFKSVEGGAGVKIKAIVDSLDNKSVVYITGEWNLNLQGQMMVSALTGVNSSSSGAYEVVFKKNYMTEKGGIAFQYMYKVASHISNEPITYSK